MVPDAKALVVTVPKWKTDALVVDAWVTDQTVIRDEKVEKRLEDLNVGGQVWTKFERVSSGDIAHLIVVKPGTQRE